jgi:hypothetical protein
MSVASMSALSTLSAPASTPPDATLTFGGDQGLAGPLGDASVTCSFPDPDGLQIAVIGIAADGTTSYRVAISPDTVLVHVDSDDNGTFIERNFAGPGVTQFDPTVGAQIDATLTEAPPTPGTGAGAIGAVNSLKGSVDCVGQSPGASTITLDGATATGTFDHANLDPALVECSLSHDEVVLLGIVHATDGTRELFKVSLSNDGIHIDQTTAAGGRVVYTGGADGVTLTPQGGTVNGDAVEQDSQAPHTLHVQGDATCGTPLR